MLFLEYFPSNLYDWLGTQIINDINTISTACSMIENELEDTISFMKKHQLLHMDAHFWNILTDGDHLYFSDFGLALSSKFELSPSEVEFFNKHQSYDDYSSVTNFLHCIVTQLFGQDEWITNLKACIEGENKLPTVLQSLIEKYAPIAICMDKFYRKLQNESKNTPFPGRIVNYKN